MSNSARKRTPEGKRGKKEKKKRDEREELWEERRMRKG